MMDFSFSNESGSMSSASSCSKEMFCFYSAPTSPSRLKLREHTGFQTGPSTPRGYEAEDVNSNFNEFEFETSRRFNHSELGGTETNQKDVKVKPFDHKQEQQRLCGDSLLPTMAFADELFCDGRVLPLIPPLKLPPRLLQKGDGNNLSTQSSTVTSPRSPGSVFRLPFSRHSLWNDGFDPFMVALEKVREEKRGKPKGNHGLRRSRSLSPLRSFNSNRSDKHVGLSHSHQPESHCCDPAQLICELQKEPLKQASEPKLKQASGKINMLSEPKGLVNDTNFEPKRTSVSKVAAETKKDEGQRGGGFWTRSKKREKIKRFLFGNANKDKASVQHKLLEDSKEALGKPTLLRKHDMKSVTSSTQWNKDETTTGELTKMRLAFHRQAIAKTFSLLGL